MQLRGDVLRLTINGIQKRYINWYKTVNKNCARHDVHQRRRIAIDMFLKIQTTLFLFIILPYECYSPDTK